MMKSILLPTDGTVPSEEAALYAMDMAKRLRAKVKALYAVDDSLYTTYHWAKIREQVIKELEKANNFREALSLVKDAKFWYQRAGDFIDVKKRIQEVDKHEAEVRKKLP